MNTEPRTVERRSAPGGLLLLLAVLAVTAWFALAPRALAETTPQASQSANTVKPTASATLEQCVTSGDQSERSATFSGEMATIPGAVKLEMRIDVLERMPSDLTFHAVSSPGPGVWRTAAPGVKSYKYLKAVTNLSAPASYRASVRFRWLNAKGKLIRSAELRTPRCVQSPLGPKSAEETAPTT
jgi:hypothetical protein